MMGAVFEMVGNSAGRVPRLHRGSRGFESCSTNQFMAYKNPADQRAYARKWMKDRYCDPEFRVAHKAKVKATKAKLLAGYAAALTTFRAAGCSVCGEHAACCMDAHHRDPSTKEFTLGTACRNRVGIARFKAELAKCVCVCANCHRKLHAGLISLRGSSARLE